MKAMNATETTARWGGRPIRGRFPLASNIDPVDSLDALLARRAVTVLDDPEGDESEPDVLLTDSEEDAVDAVLLVESLLAGLNARQRAVIALRFGLGGEELTLQQIGDRWGLTRERIRQIEATALRTLRARIAPDDRIAA